MRTIFLGGIVMDNLTIMKTRKMTKQRLEIELGKHTKYLEELGMNHNDACNFVSNVMNIGIYVQEIIRKRN